MAFPQTEAGRARMRLRVMSAVKFSELLRKKYPVTCYRMTHTRLGRIERGELTGTLEERKAIAEELGVNPWLQEGE